MLKRVLFDQLRGFTSFEMKDFGRVNLLVGTNNCGKSTALEGIQILTAAGDVSAIWSILSRRGEDVWDERDDGRFTRHMDVRRLFHGHGADVGRSFTISGQTEAGPISLAASIVESIGGGPENRQVGLFEGEVGTGTQEEFVSPRFFKLSWRGLPNEPDVGIVLGRRGGIALETIRRATGTVPENARKNLLITASALSPEVVIELFEAIVLTPEEDSVIEALRIIEPSIERIATSGTDRTRNMATRQLGSRGGMLVRCTGIKDRIPIGSMGDGIWRMLGLALALVHAENGILLVDEIDTGLHFSVMADMWRLVYKTARRFNVQVFASTHSRDCYQSLAAICRETVTEGSDITIQRLEKGKKASVAYTEQEIIAASERGMEVR